MKHPVALLLGVLVSAVPPLAAQQSSPRGARRAPRTPPIQWMTVSPGTSHPCALDLTGLAFCWGDNAWHRLGVADSVNIRRPVRVETPQHFRLISAGETETCAVSDRGGGIVCWGGPYPGTLPRTVLADRSYQSIALASNTCAVSSDGNGWCWGSNRMGQLGSGSPHSEVSASPQPLAGGRHWRTIEPGPGGFACGLTDAGIAMCWGSNSAGQLGTGSAQGSRIPLPVVGSPRYQALTVGGEHACGLGADGAAWCWGNGQAGALGTGRAENARTPQRVSGPQHWTELVAGYDFTCGLDDTGRAWCWGKNTAGVLGTGDRTDHDVPAPVRSSQRFVALSAGNAHVCGISDRAIYCWGDNADGQLGIARAQTCRTPMGPEQTDVRQCALVPTRIQDPRQ